MEKQALKLVQFKDGDLIHVVHSWINRNKQTIHECVVVASREGREGGELSLTQHELEMNLMHH